MTKILTRLLRNRRGAIAFIFAGALLPLVMLIGLSIDYSFYVQARSQFSLAADASATYAIREATAAYQLNGNDPSNAATAGQNGGAAWFTAQLATLPTATINGGSPTITVVANQLLSPTNPAGFTATVNYAGVYPPFFNGLFKQTSKWSITGSSIANSQYSYVELLILMDDSGSMLVSADNGNNSAPSTTNPGGILTMDNYSACIPNAQVDSSDGLGAISAYTDPLNFVSWSSVQNLSSTTGLTASNASNLKCKPHMNGNTSGNTTTVDAPCAFACHTTNNTFSGTGLTYVNGVLSGPSTNTYTKDLYGLARQQGVLLKTDVVFQSTESIISKMQNAHQVSGQFTVGVYSFDADACPIVLGSGTDPTPEATSNLLGALTTVQSYDYTQTPTETKFPPIPPNANGNTNFPLSVSDLIHGTMSKTNCTTVTTQHALASKPPTGTIAGTTAAYPEKNIFIVTDGMEDSQDGTDFASNNSNTCGRVLGEMAGVVAEQTNSTANCDTAVCKALQNLGFTVYVLQIGYPAVQNTFYYDKSPQSDQYIADDFPSTPGVTTSSGGTAEVWNTGITTSSTGTTTTVTATPPNQTGLQACATPGDFYQASTSTDIQTAMSKMLKSALEAAVRITQ